MGFWGLFGGTSQTIVQVDAGVAFEFNIEFDLLVVFVDQRNVDLKLNDVQKVLKMISYIRT